MRPWTLPLCVSESIAQDRYLIKPMAGKIREAILECADKRHWTPLTTEDKVKLDLSIDFKDPMHIQVFAAL